MKKLLSILFLCLFASANAQQPAEKPLEYVSADSVLLMDIGWRNFTKAAQRVHFQVKAQPIVPDTASCAELLESWAAMQPRMNATGSLGWELADDAGRSAARVFHTAAQLFALTGEGKYADVMERTLFNALSHAAATPARPVERYEAARALACAPGVMYARGEKGIYVNYYLNAFARFAYRGGMLQIDQVTQMPMSPRVRLCISTPRGRHRFSIFLRVPAWAEGSEYPVYVNGKEIFKRKVVDGYLQIDRDWSTGDEIFFDLPLTPRFTANAADPSLAMLGCGPLTYAAVGVADSSAYGASPEKTIVMARGEEVYGFDCGGFIAVPFALLPDEGDCRVWLKRPVAEAAKKE